MKKFIFLIIFSITVGFLFSQTCYDGDLTCNSEFSDTTANGNSNFDSYSCCNWEETGKEKIYRLVLDDWADVDISFTSLSADLDLFILTDCNNPDSCISYGDNEISTRLDAGTYYVVVDGNEGAEGDFTFNVTCLYNCVDEEISGDIDEIGDTSSGDNVLSNYSCTGSTDFSGSEYVYHFHLDSKKIIKIKLLTSYNLSIFLLTNCNDGNSCIGYGSDKMLKSLDSGDYYISIDSPPGDEGNYRIIVKFFDCFDKEITGSSYEDSDDTHNYRSIYDSYGCYGGDESGPEVIYKFEINDSSVVDVYLSNEVNSHTIFVLDECGNPDSCILSGTGHISGNLSPGIYYLIVDSDDNPGSYYHLQFFLSETNCFLSEIPCNSTINGNTSEGIALREHYNCGFYDETGKECVYKIDLPEDEYLTVKLNSSNSLRIYLLTDCEDENSCIAYSQVMIRKLLNAGTYFVSVDSNSNSDSDFSLEVDCDNIDCYQEEITTSGNYSSSTSNGVSNISSYSGVNWDESGSEYIYKLNITENSFLGITFNPVPDVDLDLFLLSDCESGDDLLLYGDNQIIVENLSKGIYFLSVDGAVEGDFTINVSMDTPLKMGDINDDGVVNVMDANLLSSFLVGDVLPSAINLKAADVKYDLDVNATDYVVLENYLVGNITSLPLEESKPN